MQWLVKNWEELSKEELYQILKFRMQIFILEQKSFFLDLDDEDQLAYHFLAEADNHQLVAYGRLFINPTKSLAFIRRISVAPNYRQQRLATSLMQRIVDFAQAQYPNITMELDAQHHLQAFYALFGFKPQGEPYDDDGILHINMISHSMLE